MGPPAAFAGGAGAGAGGREPPRGRGIEDGDHDEVEPHDVDQGLPDDLVVAALRERSMRPDVPQADLQLLVVDPEHVGLLEELRPGDAAVVLDPVRARSATCGAARAPPSRPTSRRLVLDRRLGGFGRRRLEPLAATSGSGSRVPARPAARVLQLALTSQRVVLPGALRAGAARGAGLVAPAASALRGAGDGHPPLDAVEPRGQAQLVVVGTRQQQLGADQLEVQPWRGRALHVGDAGGDQLGAPGQRGQADPVGLRLQPRPLVVGAADEPPLEGVLDRGDDHQVTEPLEQVLHEALGVEPGIDDRVDDAEQGGAVAVGDGVDDLVEQRRRREAEQLDRALVGQVLRLGTADQLVEHAQRVTHRARSGADHGREHPRLDGDRPLTHRPLRGSPRGCATARAGTGSGACATGSCR